MRVVHLTHLLALAAVLLTLPACAHLDLPLPGAPLPDRSPYAACVQAEVIGKLELEVVKPASLGACAGTLTLDIADCRAAYGADTPLPPSLASTVQGGIALALPGLAALIASSDRTGATADAWVMALHPQVADLGAQAVEELSPLGDGVIAVDWTAPAVGACAVTP